MTKRWAIAGVLGLWVLGARPASAGDSFWGKVTEVKAGDAVTLDNGEAHFDVRLVGIELPRDAKVAEEARDLVSRLVLGKNARLRLERKEKGRAMVGRLLTDDPEVGFKDVGLELVRNGLARRTPGYDYKYGELSRAEREAREGKRGLWASARSR